MNDKCIHIFKSRKIHEARKTFNSTELHYPCTNSQILVYGRICTFRYYVILFKFPSVYSHIQF